tara:strand:+ start:433 stop:849 length:417 start_codon:yes stop_codon:yes gene_type:complete
MVISEHFQIIVKGLDIGQSNGSYSLAKSSEIYNSLQFLVSYINDSERIREELKTFKDEQGDNTDEKSKYVEPSKINVKDLSNTIQNLKNTNINEDFNNVSNKLDERVLSKEISNNNDNANTEQPVNIIQENITEEIII